jgi:nucleoside-diphosphate-sugar epimerase
MKLVDRNNESSILITGASGFVGNALCDELISKNFNVIASSRRATNISKKIEQFRVNSIDQFTDWTNVLPKCDTVIHLAAKAHDLKDSGENKISSSYKTINTLATINLAKQSINHGIKKFIFISTIGVNGSNTPNKAFSFDDISNPHSPYAKSKYEAEKALNMLVKNSGMKLIIIRPPLIYSLNAPGNLNNFIKLVKYNVPLPFKNVKNKRSFISLENLINLISHCLNFDECESVTILASNGKEISTKDLLTKIGSDLNIKVKFFYFPISLFAVFFYLLQKKRTFNSLFGDLVIDITHTRKVIHWEPQDD